MRNFVCETDCMRYPEKDAERPRSRNPLHVFPPRICVQLLSVSSLVGDGGASLQQVADLLDGGGVGQVGLLLVGQAEQRVKIELTLEAIRKAEGLEPTEEEVDAQIAKQAERMGQEVEAFKAGLTEEQQAYMVDTAAIQKVCDLLKADATINTKADAEDEE